MQRAAISRADGAVHHVPVAATLRVMERPLQFDTHGKAAQGNSVEGLLCCHAIQETIAPLLHNGDCEWTPHALPSCCAPTWWRPSRPGRCWCNCGAISICCCAGTRA